MLRIKRWLSTNPSVQPLIANAIHHGNTILKEPGKAAVSWKNYEVTLFTFQMEFETSGKIGNNVVIISWTLYGHHSKSKYKRESLEKVWPAESKDVF